MNLDKLYLGIIYFLRNFFDKHITISCKYVFLLLLTKNSWNIKNTKRTKEMLNII